MNSIRLVFSLAMFGVLLTAGCAGRQAAEPLVTLHENGRVRQIPARCFDEASYLKRGYLKNTDGQGSAIYVFVPETDRQAEEVLGGNTGQGILWYGDRGGGQGGGGMGAVGLSGGGGSYN